MSAFRILVLGASGAGLKAAARARRLLPGAHVAVVDRRADIGSYTCGLPLYLSGDVERIEALGETSYGARRDAAFFRQIKDVEVMTGARIVALDRDTRAVTIERAADGSGRTMLLYDKLVYALGARPRVPPGFQLGQAVLSVASSRDAVALRGALQAGEVGSCLVVGGGCAAVETAAALADLWGCEVTLLEAADRLLPHLLDADLSRLVAAELDRVGVRVRTGLAATGAADAEDGHATVAAGGERLIADRAVLALGTTPRTELARSAGLAVGEGGGLLVDGQLRTSDPDILAAGDCIELVHHTSGELCRLPLGSLASRQGRVAGDVLAGRFSEIAAVVASRAVKVLGLNVAVCGLSAAAARAADLDPVVTTGAFCDRAHYHPEQALIHLQLVHEAGSGRLLGLQAVGPGDVVKRVDVFAALLRQDGDLGDLLDAEFCCAPPYNAALDPLHELAAAALSQQEGRAIQAGPFSDPGGRLVLDVRTPAEVAAAADALPGAVNIPLADLRQRAGELPADRPLLVVCAKGSRSAEAAGILRERGFADVVYLAGGMTMRAGGRSGARAPGDD